MRLIFSLLAGAAASLIAAAPAMAQTSYTLWCRGGGDHQQMAVSTNVDAAGRVLTSFQLAFERMGAAATAATPPAAGQCSWLDRPLNNAENGLLRGAFRDVATSSTLDGGRLAALDFSGAADGVAAMRTLFAAYREGREFRVEVYNDGSALRVTRVQP